MPRGTEKTRSFGLGDGIPNVKIVFKPLYLKVNIRYLINRRLSKVNLFLSLSKN